MHFSQQANVGKLAGLKIPVVRFDDAWVLDRMVDHLGVLSMPMLSGFGSFVAGTVVAYGLGINQIRFRLVASAKSSGM